MARRTRVRAKVKVSTKDAESEPRHDDDVPADDSKGNGKGKSKDMSKGVRNKGNGKGKRTINPRLKKAKEADASLPTTQKPMALGNIPGAARFLSDLASTRIVSYLTLSLLGIQAVMCKLISDLIENAGRKQNFTLLPVSPP